LGSLFAIGFVLFSFLAIDLSSQLWMPTELRGGKEAPTYTKRCSFFDFSSAVVFGFLVRLCTYSCFPDQQTTFTTAQEKVSIPDVAYEET